MKAESLDFGRVILNAILGAARTMVTDPNGRLLIAIVVFAFLIKWLFRWLELRRLARARMDEVDRMSGRDFEKLAEILFRRLGYSVERTQYIGDYGADLVLAKDGVRTVVQAKRWKGKVGIKAVQEAVAAKGKYGCTEAMVLTNSTYTANAAELARANHVRLWDRDDLIRARLEMRREAPVATPVPAPVSEIPSGTGSGHTVLVEGVCAACGKPVSEKVRQYCEDHAERFGGRVYCFEHQRGSGRTRPG